MDMLGNTICAVSSGGGSSPIAIVRISGEKSLCALEHIIARKNEFEHGKAQVRALYSQGKILDKAVVVFFKSPRSFTGEDGAEIYCHGSPYIKSRILTELFSIGIKPAGPGEFSMRAFLNGKIDLSQAEGINDLIASQTETAHRTAMSIADGELSKKTAEIKAVIADIFAEIQARIDDNEEEIPPLNGGQFCAQLNKAVAGTESLADTYKTGASFKNGIRVSIVGAPNCGKSSLLNRLTGYGRAIISPEPGTTRDTIEECIDISGIKIILTDTAGIRAHCADTAEKEGIERARKSAQNADIIIFVADACAQNSGVELLSEILNGSEKKIIIAFNKIDIAKDAPKFFAQYPADAQLAISCKTGEGIEKLKAKITGIADIKTADSGLLITSMRHFAALNETAGHIKQAIEILRNEESQLELVAAHLSDALNSLGQISGEVYTEDILDIIFSKFCVGK